MRSLIDRINDRLANGGHRLRGSVTEADWLEYGSYRIVNVGCGTVIRHHVDLDELAAELGVAT